MKNLFEYKGNDLQINKDAHDGDLAALKRYLTIIDNCEFKSSFPPFKFQQVDGLTVIDESAACPVGAKARFGEFFFTQIEEDEIVYVQPRQGFAGISLAWLCKKYDKKLTLIMPSSKEASSHQRLCIELGATPKFVRIAAMPNANLIAQKYARFHNAKYVPLGLQHRDVIAGAVSCIHENFRDREHPKKLWCVISTGVLCRALQIALPETEIHAVAVARNIRQGELGRAKFYSYHKTFSAKSDVVPEEFDCEPSYDSKGWDYASKFADEGDYFFSVAGKAPETSVQPENVDSQRDWGDFRDLPELKL